MKNRDGLIPVNRKLPLAPPLGLDETATSYTSRLAVRNGAGSAPNLCCDLGLSWSGIIRGDPCELDALASYGGVSAETLERTTLRAANKGTHWIRGEIINKTILKRATVRVCPHCIKTQLDENLYSVYRPLTWELSPIRTCHIHSRPLIALNRVETPRQSYDFCQQISTQRRRIRAEAKRIVFRRSSRLEDYIRNRIAGEKHHPWLDTMPLHVVSNTSEMLGLRIERKPHAKTEDCAWKAGAIGFDVLSEGPEVFRQYLQSFRSNGHDSRSKHSRDLGVFYKWLSTAHPIADYDPIRDFVRTFIFETYPLTQGAKVLKKTLKERHWYSVDRASRELGVKIGLLKCVLCELGSSDFHQVNIEKYIAAKDFPVIRSELSNLVSGIEARKCLNVTERVFPKFIDVGLVREIKVFPSKLARFSMREIEGILDQAFSGSNRINNLERDQALLQRAAMLARCTTANVVKLVVDKRIQFVGRLVGKTGIQALVVRPREVIDALRS